VVGVDRFDNDPKVKTDELAEGSGGLGVRKDDVSSNKCEREAFSCFLPATMQHFPFPPSSSSRARVLAADCRFDAACKCGRRGANFVLPGVGI